MLSKFYAVVTCEGDARWYFRTYEEAKAYALSLFKEDYDADERLTSTILYLLTKKENILLVMI